MTSKNKVFKTPKKDKSWAYVDQSMNITTDGGSMNLLTEYNNDLGIVTNRNLTVMRMFGQIQLQEAGNASGAGYVHVRLGFAWIQDGVISIGGPWDSGIRRKEWLQLGQVEGTEVTSGFQNTRAALARPNEASQWDFDFTQMRTCPTPAHELLMVFETNGLQEANTLKLHVRVAIMLALP